MKENADKYLDDLSRKVIGKSALERPSLDFTQSVMSQVEAISNSSITTYKPLISKSVWLVITLLATSGVVYILFGAQSKSLWLQQLNLEHYISFSNWIPSLEVSQTTVYVAVLYAIMFCIQIPLLKHQLNQRFK